MTFRGGAAGLPSRTWILWSVYTPKPDGRRLFLAIFADLRVFLHLYAPWAALASFEQLVFFCSRLARRRSALLAYTHSFAMTYIAWHGHCLKMREAQRSLRGHKAATHPKLITL